MQIGFEAQIIIPIFCALLGLVARSNKLSSFLTLFAGTSLLACTLTATMDQLGTQYLMGNWPAQFGIELKLGAFGTLFLFIANFSLLTYALVSIFNPPNYLESALVLLAQVGFNGALLTNDAFNMYVFLEISSLTSYALVAILRKDDALRAAFNYLVFGTIAATLYLLGVGFLYLFSGSLNLDFIALERDSLHSVKPLLKVGFLFCAIGQLIKLSVPPVHGWLILVYRHAKKPVAAYLSGASSNTSLYILVFILFKVMGASHLESMGFLTLFQVVGGFSVIFGGVKAATSSDFRDVLGFSSISHFGFALIGLASGNMGAASASLFLTLTHALSKPLLFLSDPEALNRKMSTLQKIMQLAIVCNLVGIPPLPGFFAKLELMSGVLRSGNYEIFVVALLGSGMSALYGYKIIEITILAPKFHPAPGPHMQKQPEFGYDLSVVQSVSLLAMAATAFYSERMTALLHQAAQEIMG